MNGGVNTPRRDRCERATDQPIREGWLGRDYIGAAALLDSLPRAQWLLGDRAPTSPPKTDRPLWNATVAHMELQRGRRNVVSLKK